MNGEALALVKNEEINPAALMRQATDVSGLVKDLVVRTAVTIGKRKFLPVEAWTTIAMAHGCMPSVREVIETDKGVRAICDLRRSDGVIVASAEGFVGNDEPTWAARPMYAKRAMCQTRSISRVCRTAFAHIVVMMNAGLSTTPAEEIPADDREADKPEPRVVHAVPVGTGAEPERSKATTVRFGKSKGKFLCDIDDDDLRWQLAAAIKSVEANDPKWGDANMAWAKEVQKEAARRIQG